MIKRYYNFINGELDANLAIAGTTMTSSDLTALPDIVAPDIATIALDPEGASPEIVYITAHTDGANTATILRAQEGTTASAFSTGTPFVHALLSSDIGDRLHIGPTAPTDDPGAYLWVQTGLGGGDGFTFWFEDGQ